MKKQSNIILKITLFKHIRAIFSFLFFISCPIAVVIYHGKMDLSKAQLEFIIILTLFAAYYAFLTLPALFYHIDYFIRNGREEYEIGNKKIVRRKNGAEIVYHVEDIDDIYMCLSPPKFRNDFFSFCAWDQYHFAKIVMKSGEVLYLTSLLYPSGLEKVLGKYLKVSYWSEERWFPTTLYCPPPSDQKSEEEDDEDSASLNTFPDYMKN